MCNIAGYVGSDRAAPALIEMMSRQEGWAGGYYTGIATIHEGKLHMRKVVGDLGQLLRHTDAATLPGTIGILHSRSASGGDREWAHPFVTADGTLAYVANGYLGSFAKTTDVNAVAARLRGAGYTFRSHTRSQVGSYPALADGSCMHFSDLMCGLIHYEASTCWSLGRGMMRAYSAFPGEIVGLAITAADPEAIHAARISMPMMLGRTDRALLLATTALAFPDTGVYWVAPVPANTVVRVTQSQFEGMPLEPCPGATVGPLPWAQAEAAVLAVLADGKPHDLGALKQAVAAAWPADGLQEAALVVYEILRGLHRAGRLEVVSRRVEGVLPELTAPRFSACLRPAPGQSPSQAPAGTRQKGAPQDTAVTATQSPGAAPPGAAAATQSPGAAPPAAPVHQPPPAAARATPDKAAHRVAAPGDRAPGEPAREHGKSRHPVRHRLRRFLPPLSGF